MKLPLWRTLQIVFEKFVKFMALKCCFIVSVFQVNIHTPSQQQPGNISVVVPCRSVQCSVSRFIFFVYVILYLQQTFDKVSSVAICSKMKSRKTIHTTHIHRHSVLNKSFKCSNITKLYCKRETRLMSSGSISRNEKTIVYRLKQIKFIFAEISNTVYSVFGRSIVFKVSSKLKPNCCL